MKYGEENSRIDIMLQADDRQKCYIEVKSVTLAEKEYGYFPDAVTTRGQKHCLLYTSEAAQQASRAFYHRWFPTEKKVINTRLQMQQHLQTLTRQRCV